MAEIRVVAAGIESLTQIEGASDECEVLDASHNEISDLEGLSAFPSLQTLNLDNNKLCSLDGLPSLPNLKTLWLNNCRIMDTEAALLLLGQRAPQLQYLSLMGNPGCKSEITGATKEESDRYRVYTVFKLPSLRLLDFATVTPEEKERALSKGEFLKLAKPVVVDKSDDIAEAQTNRHLEAAQIKRQQPTFGKQRRFYTGKFSEGNRFIRDDVL